MYFTKREALERAKETLECGYAGYYCDLHHEVFNTDYYIVYTSEAEKALEQYGVYKAIGKVVSYERDNFGEQYTDISDPVKVANMLWYIIGEEAIADLETVSEHWDATADEDSNAEIVAEIEEYIEED